MTKLIDMYIEYIAILRIIVNYYNLCDKFQWYHVALHAISSPLEIEMSEELLYLNFYCKLYWLIIKTNFELNCKYEEHLDISLKI